MKRKRIFIGTSEIGNLIYLWGEALRTMGHEVYTVTRKKNKFYSRSLYSEIIPYDNNIKILNDFLKEPLQGLLANGDQLMKIRSLLVDHDIYIFLFGHSILGDLDDLILLKKLGKKIICIFLGNDLRVKAGYDLHCKYNKVLHQIPLYSRFGLNEKLRKIRLAELHSDAIYGAPNLMALSLKAYFQINIAININKIHCNIPNRDVPVIIHAPSNPVIKGSKIIIKALNDLKEEGINFEFVLLENTDNSIVLQNLSNADIAVDQLYSEGPATFALEAMAAGCAVLCGNRPDTVPYPPDRPCIDVDPDSMKDKLKELIINKNLRTELASKGRDYVCKWHSPEASASRLLEGLTRSRNDDYDYYPSLFINKFEQSVHEPLNDESKQLNMSVLKTMNNINEEQWESLKVRGLIPD